MIHLENVLFTITLIMYLAAMLIYFIFIAAKKDAVSKVAATVHIAGLVIHTAAIVVR